GLGALHTISLDEARELARGYRKMLMQGKDPKAERDRTKLEQQIAAGLTKTASQVADEYFETFIARKSLSYRTMTASYLKTFVHNTIGDMPIQKVTLSTILDKVGLRELWAQQNPTARMVRAHLHSMFGLAIARGYYHEGNPLAADLLKSVLPKRRDVHKTTHH